MSRNGDLNNLFTGGLSTAGIVVLFVVVTPMYFAIKYWYATLTIVGFVLFIWALICAIEKVQKNNAETARKKAAVIARAEKQHAWVMAGDDRGIYGDYPPEGN